MNAERIGAAAKIVCSGLLEGLPVRYACVNAEIAEKTYLVWRMRGENILEASNNGKDVSGSLDQAYMDFFLRTERAHGEYVRTLVKCINNGSNPDNVEAATWELERRYPEEYSESENLYSPKKNGEDEDENSMIDPDISRERLLKQCLSSDPDDDCDS